jgi:hypothetical protein
MVLPDVKRLAALDMWGSVGSLRRRRLIRAEFFLGAVGCTVLGLLAFVRGSGWIAVVGAWLVGAGINYVPLALYARSLSRPGALEAELDGVDTRRELRRAGVQQLWIAVPLAVAITALAQELLRTRA